MSNETLVENISNLVKAMELMREVLFNLEARRCTNNFPMLDEIEDILNRIEY